MGKIIKKMIIAQVVWFLILATFVCWGVKAIAGQIGKHEADLKSKLGKEYVIQGDTLTVVNYKLLEDTLVLSNGVEISEELVD